MFRMLAGIAPRPSLLISFDFTHLRPDSSLLLHRMQYLDLYQINDYTTRMAGLCDHLARGSDPVALQIQAAHHLSAAFCELTLCLCAVCGLSTTG